MNMLLSFVLIFTFVVICCLWVTQGSRDTAPQDTELVQQTLAAVNLQHFSESLLRDAFYPDYDPNKPVSCRTLQRLLASEEGQDAARAIAMESIIHEYKNAMPSRGRYDGEMSIFHSLCESVPWISWLIDCGPDLNDIDEIRLPGYILHEPLNITTYEWASCHSEFN